MVLSLFHDHNILPWKNGCHQDYEIQSLSKNEVDAFFVVNAVSGCLFLVGIALTVCTLARRELDDLFLKYALYCLLVAQIMTAIMSCVIASYDGASFFKAESVPFQ